MRETHLRIGGMNIVKKSILGAERKIQEGEDICILTADSCCCMACLKLVKRGDHKSSHHKGKKYFFSFLFLYLYLYQVIGVR